MRVPAATSRRDEVQPLSARTELVSVIRMALVILIGAWMYLATDSPKFGATDPSKKDLLPFQALIQDRPSTDQRIFRELQEGLLEAEMRRADQGAWPEVSALAADGVPPFARDPTAKAYTWHLIVGGTFVNYLGTPSHPEDAAWLVHVQEPGQGAPPDPAGEDEEHHRLRNGEMLHVSIWTTHERPATDRIVRLPQGERWTQLYAVGPAASGPLSVRSR